MFREATSSEIDGHVASGSTLFSVPVASNGDWSATVLSKASTPEVVSSKGATVTKDDTTGQLTFSFPSGSGYTKSSCSTSGIPDCGSGSAKFVIKPNGANSILVTAYKAGSGEATSQYWSGYVASATISYVVSTGPTETERYVKYAPSVKETTYEQEYRWHIYTPSNAEEESKVFLTQGSTATQNFAFEIEE